MDFLQIVLLANIATLLILWFIDRQMTSNKNQPKNPGKPKEILITTESKNPKPTEKKIKVPERLDENWLKKELSDLAAYIEEPSALKKFFLSLKHTSTNPRDLKVIESYEHKLTAAIKVMEKVIDYAKTGARTAQIEKEIELEDLKREDELYTHKVSIAAKKKELAKLEDKPAAPAKHPHPELNKYLGKLKTAEAAKQAIFLTLKAEKEGEAWLKEQLKDQGLNPDDPEYQGLFQRLKHVYQNIIIEGTD